MILGDFHFPRVKWISHEVIGGTTEKKLQPWDLLTLMENRFLTQLIKEPTRESNILDLFPSNNHIIHNYVLRDCHVQPQAM